MASSRDFRAASSGWSFCATGRHPWFRQRATCMWETDNPAWRSLVATRRVLGFAMLSQIFRALAGVGIGKSVLCLILRCSRSGLRVKSQLCSFRPHHIALQRALQILEAWHPSPGRYMSRLHSTWSRPLHTARVRYMSRRSRVPWSNWCRKPACEPAACQECDTRY